MAMHRCGTNILFSFCAQVPLHVAAGAFMTFAVSTQHSKTSTSLEVVTCKSRLTSIFTSSPVHSIVLIVSLCKAAGKGFQ